MRRGDEKRFARLEERVRPDLVEERRSRRRGLRMMVAGGWLIHDMAAAAGVEPDSIPALRRAEMAAIELAALGGYAAEAAEDYASDGPVDDAPAGGRGEAGRREELLRRLDRIGASYADGARPPPDAPFLTWLGWAMAQPPLSLEVLETLHADASAGRLAAADAGRVRAAAAEAAVRSSGRSRRSAC